MTVFEKVRELIAEDSATDPAIIVPDATLEGGDIYTSMDAMEGLLACEEFFEIELSDEEVAAINNTVGGLVCVIEGKLRSKYPSQSYFKGVTF